MVIAGLLVVLQGLPTLVSSDLQASAQGQGTVLANPLFDIAAILVLAGVVLAAWVISRRRAVRGAQRMESVTRSGGP